MTVPAPAGGEHYPVRVMVMSVWDTVAVQVNDDTTVATLKREALRQALKRSDADDREYVVKFRGAAVLDESITLRTLGVPPNAPFILVPARRQPVR